MALLIQANLTPQAAVSAMTTGSRFGGVEAAAINMLAPLGGKDQGTLGAIRNTMFATAVAALTSADAGSDSGPALEDAADVVPLGEVGFVGIRVLTPRH